MASIDRVAAFLAGLVAMSIAAGMDASSNLDGRICACGATAATPGSVDILCDPPVPLLEVVALEPAEIVLPVGLVGGAAEVPGGGVLEGYQRLTLGPVGAISTTLINETFESTWPSAGWQVGINSGKADARWGRSRYRKASGSYSIWCAKSGSAAPPDGGTVPKNMTI